MGKFLNFILYGNPEHEERKKLEWFFDDTQEFRDFIADNADPERPVYFCLESEYDQISPSQYNNRFFHDWGSTPLYQNPGMPFFASKYDPEYGEMYLEDILAEIDLCIQRYGKLDYALHCYSLINECWVYAWGYDFNLKYIPEDNLFICCGNFFDKKYLREESGYRVTGCPF